MWQRAVARLRSYMKISIDDRISSRRSCRLQGGRVEVGCGYNKPFYGAHPELPRRNLVYHSDGDMTGLGVESKVQSAADIKSMLGKGKTPPMHLRAVRPDGTIPPHSFVIINVHPTEDVSNDFHWI
jgi:hypothetical protein